MRCDSTHKNLTQIRLLVEVFCSDAGSPAEKKILCFSFPLSLSLSDSQSLVVVWLLRERCFRFFVNLNISPAAKSIKQSPIFELYVWLLSPFVSALINRTHTRTCADCDWRVRRFVSMRTSAKTLFFFVCCFVFPWNQIFIFLFLRNCSHLPPPASKFETFLFCAIVVSHSQCVTMCDIFFAPRVWRSSFELSIGAYIDAADQNSDIFTQWGWRVGRTNIDSRPHMRCARCEMWNSCEFPHRIFVQRRKQEAQLWLQSASPASESKKDTCTS